MKRRYIAWAATSLLCATATESLAQATAQKDSTLNRTVVVENLYNPDIMNANKVNIVPTLEEPQTVKKAIDYAIVQRPALRFGFSPIENFGTTPLPESPRRGYLRAGYGTNGNADARLSYRFDWGQRDRLDALVQFRGMDGTIDLPDSRTGKTEWEARSYRTQGGLDWTHRFNTLTLGVRAEGENQVFNYPTYPRRVSGGHQHNMLGDVRVSLANNQSDADIRFKASTGLLYAKQKYAFRTDDTDSHTEYIIRTRAHAAGDLNERTTIHIAAQMDNFFHSPGGNYDKVSNTSLQLNPYLTSEGKQWKARIGMHLDPFIRKGGTHFSLAPDLYGEYTVAEGYSIYLQAGGGRVLNDFRRVNALDPYADFPPYLTDGPSGEGFYNLRHAYDQLDGRLGIKATPMNELGLHLYGGYRMTEDKLFSVSTTKAFCGALMQDDANAIYAGASAQYTWKEFFTTRAEFEWSRWDCDVLDQYVALVPELMFHWTADVQPISGLNIGVSYRFEQYTAPDGMSSDQKPDAMNLLGVTASYRLLPQLTVFVKGDNLLDASHYRYITVPTQGIHVLAGASLEF